MNYNEISCPVDETTLMLMMMTMKMKKSLVMMMMMMMLVTLMKKDEIFHLSPVNEKTRGAGSLSDSPSC